ncbi:hypothetical protein I5602_003813 [Salmonella enterica]|nr:hypothetical protein [Salmonella enterica]
MLAHTWLAQAPIFLDTETTGLDDTAQALELGVDRNRRSALIRQQLPYTVSMTMN